MEAGRRLAPTCGAARKRPQRAFDTQGSSRRSRHRAHLRRSRPKAIACRHRSHFRLSRGRSFPREGVEDRKGEERTAEQPQHHHRGQAQQRQGDHDAADRADHGREHHHPAQCCGTDAHRVPRRESPRDTRSTRSAKARKEALECVRRHRHGRHLPVVGAGKRPLDAAVSQSSDSTAGTSRPSSRCFGILLPTDLGNALAHTRSGWRWSC